MKRIIVALMAAGLVLGAAQAQEVTFSPFGPHGEGGTKNGQTLKIGAGGTVFELDAFLRVNGQDLNGAAAGVAAQLSRDVLPTGLTYSFAPRLTPAGDLVMTYVFTNGTAATLTNSQFFFLLDAEIDQEANTFFNEFGVLDGTPGLGAGDVLPDRWQIDEPGFAGGQLFATLYAGTLSNSNAIPAGRSNDVALALGFALGDVQAGNSVGVAVEISGRGNSLGSLRLVQRDTAPGSTNTVTLSGLVATLAGTIFQDNSANGSPDSGEGLPNVTLRLLNGSNLVAQVSTDSSGNYTFSTPPGGTYTLSVDASTVPAGLVNTVDPDGVKDGQTTLVVVPGQLNIQNWGYRRQELKGLVFYDVNNNGVADAGDPKLAGVKLSLLSTNDVLVDQATTDVTGNYNFNAPPAGTFTLVVDPATVPSGLNNTVDPDGTADNRTLVVLAPGGVAVVNWGYRNSATGQANVTALAGMSFQWRLYQPGGWLIGRMTITNQSSGVSFAVPFQLGLPASTNYWLAHPSPGALNSGAPYVDLSTAISAALQAQGRVALAPGQVVTVDGVEVYSRNRSAPPTSLFELWATQQ